MTESKYKPREEAYDLGAIKYAEKQRQPVGGQALSIQSADPIRCSAPECGKQLDNKDAYVIVTTPRGTVVWHLWCLGIVRYGDFNDPAYAALLRQRLQGVLG